MNPYVTGEMIKRLRKDGKITQQQLAEKINVSSKTISKWETGRGYPDISLIEPLSAALGVSVIELFSGEDVVNTNRVFNMLRMKFYVCPMCGNIILSAGEALVVCCGKVLTALEPKPGDGRHHLQIEPSEDEYYISISHEMRKTHFISFIAAVKDNGCEIIKLYPEGNAEARFKTGRIQYFLYYCNCHGLFKASPQRN